ncbi:tyrosine-type recombinase/integrase [Aliiroseovarius sp. KMU-50]|uniref:Tyrosine-type recombinase/integrase n=1 Tax=Aliiroseovarius salicola TaxID=3009082 RepID=A0ABT4W5J3_9RHOB|nr:site-specific integrase [Aliiroseovarius sp. KMU-50]MDA5095799.1 tyrosine-type recombinase/integrase [Aliiroseovarius sp. KMU-50]
MAKLTDGRSGSIAKAHIPERGQRFIYDDHRDAPRGFGLRITCAGGRAFILSYTFDGRKRRKTIGDWPTWSLEAARQEARDLVQQISSGLDPLEADRRRRSEPLVSDLAREWLEKHATGLKSEAAIRGYIQNDLLPMIGRLKVSDVRRRDVIEVVEEKAEGTPRAAAQVLLYARRMFDYATDREYLPANPVAGLKPSSIKVKGKRDPLKPVTRTRVLDGEEIRKFWENVETCGLHRLTALALKFVLVTGQRPGEVAGLHKCEIKDRIWTIPAERRGKTQTFHTVYLTDLALEILENSKAELERLHQRRKADWGGYLFETRVGSPISNAALCRAVDRHHEVLGTKYVKPWGRWTPHDLRRTMRTGLSACRVRPDVAELTIGHTKTGIVAVYDQHGFDAERREALITWAEQLEHIITGQGSDLAGPNVVSVMGTRSNA